MKKILLSVIALFAAVSMNATENVDIQSIGTLGTPIAFSGSWAWKGQMLSTGDLIQDEAAGTVDDSGVTYFDASAYDYLVIKYTSDSEKIKMIIEYNSNGKIGEWGPEHNSADVQLAAATDDIKYIKLSEFKNTVSQIAFQDMGEAVNLTISEIFFATTDELKAALGGGSSEGGEEGGSEGGEEPAATGDFTVVPLNVDNALGLDSENGSPLAKDLALYDEEEGTLSIGADDTYKPMDIAAIVGGEPLKGGLQGGNNPKDADGGTPATTLLEPVSGAFFKWVAKKDGFLYIIHKANASKAYTVFEEGSALGYKFAAQGDEATPLGAVYQFEVEGEGEYNYVSTPIEWAQQEYLKEADPEFYASNWEDVEKDGVTTSTWKKIQNAEAKDIQGLGVIVFPVYAESEYVFNANGSKMMLAGIAFSANDDLTIATEDGVEIYKGGGATAIQGAKVVTVAGNSAIYNLAGQKVNASYKGIVIKDGKKYIQK